MITKPNVTSLKVLDKDEAFDFYVNKLGLEEATLDVIRTLLASYPAAHCN